MRAIRAGLPAHDRRTAFLKSLQQSRVVVVQGATGSGKSTQMPQYILEEVSTYFQRISNSLSHLDAHSCMMGLPAPVITALR